MGTPDETSAEQVRARAFQVLERAKADPEYLQRLKDDPETALQAEGFSTSQAGQLIGELGLAEVQGYLGDYAAEMCQYTCDYSCSGGTCMVTYCANMPATGGPMETR